MQGHEDANTGSATAVKSELGADDNVKNAKKNKTLVCPLHMLNQGRETLQSNLQFIAAYADVPQGEELDLMLQASVNLEMWGC